MLPKSLIKGFDTGRLKRLLTLFFLALAVPTAVLIWQAYSQLKWEAFHQYRGIAEELTNRIDLTLGEQLNAAEERSFADYTFLVVSGDPSANFVQRSPLSEFPVAQDLPGVIGYFQVGTEGEFSTPLLPQGSTDPATYGIGADEYARRLEVAQHIRSILSDNRLVRHQPAGLRRQVASLPASLADGLAKQVEAEEERDGPDERRRQLREGIIGASSSYVGDKSAVDRLYASVPQEALPKQNEAYSQTVFDALNTPKKKVDDQYAAAGMGGETLGGTLESKERVNVLGKVADLKLDSDLQRKSELAEKSRADIAFEDDGRLATPSRMKRREQIALPESEPPVAAAAPRLPAANLSAASDLRISTFESEVDPLEFSLLDSGHFVLFRKVWREGERYIQ
jgi:hypothetical protein